MQRSTVPKLAEQHHRPDHLASLLITTALTIQYISKKLCFVAPQKATKISTAALQKEVTISTSTRSLSTHYPLHEDNLLYTLSKTKAIHIGGMEKKRPAKYPLPTILTGLQICTTRTPSTLPRPEKSYVFSRSHPPIMHLCM